MPDTATEALEKFRQDANDAYDKASSSEQAKMRLLMAIHVIEESGSSHEEKFDCLNMAIKAYTCDTVIGVCDKLKDGMNKGMSVSTGLDTFIAVSKARSRQSHTRLILMIDGLLAPKQKG